ncbi:hypothetical protein [Owenweeksia hongkongensis]|uniref:hypothetical protein n=1 Tax=Owenweeksia hongkongensis TaxID=253245 RepID=UPI003A958FE9
MNETALRPRYKFSSQLSTDEIRERLKTALKDDNLNIFSLQYRSVSHHLIISFPAVHRHFWSPTLDVNLEKGAEEKITIHLLIGPEASIWTMFMFIYTIAGLAVLTGIVLGYSQFSLGKGTFLLWLIPIGSAVFLVFYFAAIAGKGKAQEQMKQLMYFFKNAVGEDELEQIVPE